MSDNHDGLEFFKGMLFGGAVGAILALLYAPKTGEEFRGELRKGLLDVKDDVEEKLVQVQKHAEELLQETREQLAALKSEKNQPVAKTNAKKTATASKKRTPGKTTKKS